MVEHFLAKEDVASSSLVTRFFLFLNRAYAARHGTVNLFRYIFFIVLPLLVSCDRGSLPETPEHSPEVAATDLTESTPTELVIEAPATAAPTEEGNISSGPPIDPKNIAGSYRDSSAPELVYELHPGNTFTATWQAADGSRGLRIEGLYQVERDEVVYLMGLNFYRKSSFLGGYDDNRVPTRKPKCYLRIEGDVLQLIADKTDAPFKVAPFTATQLSRIQD